jgi:hypothetical protein
VRPKIRIPSSGVVPRTVRSDDVQSFLDVPNGTSQRSGIVASGHQFGGRVKQIDLDHFKKPTVFVAVASVVVSQIRPPEVARRTLMDGSELARAGDEKCPTVQTCSEKVIIITFQRHVCVIHSTRPTGRRLRLLK